jgi:hypothetical protein
MIFKEEGFHLKPRFEDRKNILKPCLYIYTEKYETDSGQLRHLIVFL